MLRNGLGRCLSVALNRTATIGTFKFLINRKEWSDSDRIDNVSKRFDSTLHVELDLSATPLFNIGCLEQLRNRLAIGCIENQRLAALRDALLPRLMSGEIDVSDIEI